MNKIQYTLRPEVGLDISRFGVRSGCAKPHGVSAFRFKHFRINLRSYESCITCENAAGIRELISVIENLLEENEDNVFEHYFTQLQARLEKQIIPRLVLQDPVATRAKKTRLKNRRFIMMFDELHE